MTPFLFFLIFGVFWYGITLFYHSVFIHRYSTHKSISFTNLFWEKLFWIKTYLTMGSAYMCPKSYAIMHLTHHLHSDEKGDPHSPRFWKSFFFDVVRMMHRALKILEEINKGKSSLIKLWKDKKFPSWPDFENIANSSISMYGFVFLYIYLYYMFCPTVWLWPLILLNIFSGAIQGSLVNWYGHKKSFLSYRNFELGDDSQNVLHADFALGGEWFQNNHHKHPERANFAVKKGEIDPFFQILRFLRWLGIIKFEIKINTQLV